MVNDKELPLGRNRDGLLALHDLKGRLLKRLQEVAAIAAWQFHANPFGYRNGMATSSKIFFALDTYYDRRSGVLITNHDSGFGANILSAIEPLVALLACGIVPTEIATKSGWSPYIDSPSSSPQSLSHIFSPVNIDWAKKISSAIETETFLPVPVAGFQYRSLNSFANYYSVSRSPFGALFASVLEAYLPPSEEVLALMSAEEDRCSISSSSLSVYFRGTDSRNHMTPTSLPNASRFLSRLCAIRQLSHIVLFTDDHEIANFFLSRTNFPEVIVVGLLPLLPPTAMHSGPSRQYSDAGRNRGTAAFAFNSLLSRSQNLVLNSGGTACLTALSVLNRSQDALVWQYLRTGRLVKRGENALAQILAHGLRRIETAGIVRPSR